MSFSASLCAGSFLAKYATSSITRPLLHPTKDIEQLAADSEHLATLDRKFLDALERHPNLKNVLSFVETVPTKVLGAGKQANQSKL